MKNLGSAHGRRNLSARDMAEQERKRYCNCGGEREGMSALYCSPPTDRHGLVSADPVFGLSAPALLAPARSDLSRQQRAAGCRSTYPPGSWFSGGGLDLVGDGE